MLRNRTDPAVAERIRDLIGRVRVLVLGGDGYCGWPTALYLSGRGHDVTILDNLSRPKHRQRLARRVVDSIRPIGERLRAWTEVTGREVGFIDLDLANEYDRLRRVCSTSAGRDRALRRAARRAVLDESRQTKRYTVDNNVTAPTTCWRRWPRPGVDAALVHLGTMGVYGYGWRLGPDPRGLSDGQGADPRRRAGAGDPAPGQPWSVYHMTKTLDQLMFAFYAKNDGLRITDLHQGIVWGTQTDADRSGTSG